jgi:hypothetical protein
VKTSIFVAAAIVCLLSVPSPVGSTESGTSSVVLRNLAKAGAFQIDNSGPPVRLSAEVHIEQRVKGIWQSRYPVIHLMESCASPAPEECIELGQGKILTPAPWTGFTCSVQCITKCKKNAYLGPGVFRFVLSACDKSGKFYGDPFTLPASPEATAGKRRLTLECGTA